MINKELSMAFDYDGSEIYATLDQIEDLYVHVGTDDQFNEFIRETEDLSNFVIGTYSDWDGDTMYTGIVYSQGMMDYFRNPIYYALFYDHQKRHGLTVIKKMEIDYER